MSTMNPTGARGRYPPARTQEGCALELGRSALPCGCFQKYKDYRLTFFSFGVYGGCQWSYLSCLRLWGCDAWLIQGPFVGRSDGV